MNSNLTITKSNFLIEASYKLSLDEQRLILSCISKIDGRREVPPEIVINATDYAETFGLDLRNAYAQMEAGTNALYERDIKLSDGTAKKTRLRWVQKVTYHSGDGKVSLSFSDDVKGYIGLLKTRFTSYQFKQIAGLKSVYSIRLFELLQQWQSTGTRMVAVGWLRETLAIEKKYPLFADFRKRVIEPAVAELNAKTNLHVSYQTEKKGRQITGILFLFTEDAQGKLPI